MECGVQQVTWFVLLLVATSCQASHNLSGDGFEIQDAHYESSETIDDEPITTWATNRILTAVPEAKQGHYG